MEARDPVFVFVLHAVHTESLLVVVNNKVMPLLIQGKMHFITEIDLEISD